MTPSTEETAEHIIERLDELPRSERVRYMEEFLERVKQRAVTRETLKEAVREEREACAAVADDCPAHCGIHEKISKLIRARACD